MEQFVFIIILLLIGIALQRMNPPEDFAKSLNFFVIYVSLPATVLLQIPKITFDASLIAIILTPWLLVPFMVVAIMVMTRHHSQNVRAALLLVIPLGNTSFLGIPVMTALLGEKSLGYLMMYDQLGTFLILSLYGAAVIARYETGIFHPKMVLKKLLLFPPFGFLLFALFFGQLPHAMIPYVQNLSATLVPLALISVGYSLRLKGNFDYALLSQALILKLLIMPLLALGFLVALGVPALPLKTAVLESGMPSMITAGALAIAAGFAPELAAALVGYGLVISLVTLPLIAALLERFF